MDLENLKQLANELGLQKLRVSSGNLVASCPFAPWYHKGSDKRPSFGILIEEDGESAYNCFGCGNRGDLLTLVLELADHRETDYSHLEEWIWQNEGVGVSKAIRESELNPEDKRELIRKRFSEQVYDESEYAEYAVGPPVYAAERGFDDETCEAWEIGHHAEDKRMTFPVRRYKDGALVGIKGRTYGGSRDKYIPYLPWSQSDFFYGEHMVRRESEEPRLVVVEGELDAIRVWQAGYSGLAIMGDFPSVEQKRKLLLWDRPIVLLPDRDRQGAKWANPLGDQLKDELSVSDARVPEGKKDPGDMTLDEIRTAVENAKMRL